MTDTTASDRLQALADWVGQKLNLDQVQLTPIASDAGFRRYLRFAEPSQWLAVDAPPATEDSYQFVALARYLSTQGDQSIGTPTIYAADEAKGFLLVEDFGDELLHRQLQPGLAEARYQQAFATLLKLQACPDSPALIPRYDQAMLRRELGIFNEWFVGKLLAHPLTSAETQMLDGLYQQLEGAALSQPQCLVHRDFHSRNLIIRRDSQDLGVIDFQGALWGACTYDLVSLLRDCYLRWPAQQVRHWALDYCQLAIAAGLLPATTRREDFLRWFDWMGLQRHIKVLGIFARLHLRDGKSHYLRDLPLVIRYTLEVAEAYPELATFADWFKARLLPLAEQQSWYSDYKRAGGDE